MIHCKFTNESWQGLELQDSPWILHPITRKQGGAGQARPDDHQSWRARRKGQATAKPSVRSWGWTRLETSPMTCPHKHQGKIRNEACPPRHGGDASSSTGQDQARNAPDKLSKQGTESGIWSYNPPAGPNQDGQGLDLAMGGILQRGTRFVPDQPFHSSGRTDHTHAPTGRLCRSSPEIQDRSEENGPGKREGDLPEELLPKKPLPEEPLPEEPLPEEPLPEKPLPEEPSPDQPLPEEKEVQINQPQISAPFSPTGLAFTRTVEVTTPASICPCHNERRLSLFQEGDLPIPPARESGLSLLEGFNPGVQPIRPAGLGLSGVSWTG